MIDRIPSRQVNLVDCDQVSDTIESVDSLARVNNEILPLVVHTGALSYARPVGATSWQTRTDFDADPVEQVSADVRAARFEPVFAHGTSWRFDLSQRALVLTFAVVVADEEVPAGFEWRPARATGHAVSGALTSPSQIDVDQVVHHALRHLAFLRDEDPVARAHLRTEWLTALERFTPTTARLLCANALFSGAGP
jgi:hypothetical protein